MGCTESVWSPHKTWKSDISGGDDGGGADRAIHRVSSVERRSVVNVRHRVPPARSTIGSARVRPLLSVREKEVLLAWLASDSKSEAASDLRISAGTLNTHLQRIRLKYSTAGRDAPTKAALLARALQDGLTTLDEW